MRTLRIIADCASWFTAIAIVLVPVVVAFDYGGTLSWTQLLASYVLVIAGFAAFGGLIPDTASESTRLSRRSQIVLVIAALWLFVTWIHTQSVSPAIVQKLSPATYDAYAGWLKPLFPATDLSISAFDSLMPLSVAPDSTLHSAAIGCIMLLLIWATMWSLDSPLRVQWMLLAFSIGVGLQAFYGIWCFLVPEYAIPAGTDLTNHSAFGSFINRNNACLYLNLGFGCSIGTIVWRLSRLELLRIDDDGFELDDLLTVIQDPVAILAGVSASLCLAGLLLNGSMIGIVGLMGGVTASIRWFQSRRSAIVVAVVTLISVGLAGALIMTSEGQDSLLNRFLALRLPRGERINDDARWTHWQDGWETAWAHFPLGSGAGTYAYAYLPFQENGAYSWFHHADNLWLELFVEQGVLGLLLFVVLVGSILWATRSLLDSGEPVDHGLRFAALFCVGAVLTTQCFDFGLVLPANLMIVAVLITVVFSRSQIAHYVSGLGPAEIPAPASRRTIVAGIATGVAACLAACLALPTLHSNSISESNRYRIESILQQTATDATLLEQEMNSVSERSVKQLSPRMLMAASKLTHRLARLADLYEQAPKTEQEAIEAYQRTSPQMRRLQPQAVDSSKTPSESMDLYRQSYDLAKESLIRLPLAIEPRAQLIYLDFVSPKTTNTPLMIEQLGRLQARYPKQLVRLALLAEQSNDVMLASNLLRELSLLAPVYTSLGVGLAARHSAVDLTDAIPDQRSCQMRAAKHLLNNQADRVALAKRGEAFLARSVSLFECEKCQTKQEQSDCEMLAANVCFEIDDVAGGLEHLRKATELTPADAVKRLIYVRRLYAAGDYKNALVQAKEGRTDFSSDLRFQGMIDKMASENLEAQSKGEANPK